MKLTAEHFQHLEDSLEDNVRDLRALTVEANEGFGLLPYGSFQLNAIQGELPGSVRLRLNSCRAVLPGGYRVEILPENIQTLQIPLEPPFTDFVPNPGARYWIYLVLGSKRRPVGIPQSRPIRHPYLAPDYHIECLPMEKLAGLQSIGPNRMKIGEWYNGGLVEGYIPASICIKGIPLLEKWHQYFITQVENIVRISTQIAHEFRTRDSSRLAFVQNLALHLRASSGYFRIALPSLSPFHTVVYFIDLAGLVEGLFETLDRDFVRNTLKDGQINGLRASLQELLKMKNISFEEMALNFVIVQRFLESLILTLQNLVQSSGPIPRSGDNVIISNG